MGELRGIALLGYIVYCIEDCWRLELQEMLSQTKIMYIALKIAEGMGEAIQYE